MSDLSGKNIQRAAPHLPWSWRVRIGGGKRLTGPTGTHDKTKAEALAAKKLKEIAGRATALKQESAEDRQLGLKRITFIQACDKWLAYAEEEGLLECDLKTQVEWLYDLAGGGISPGIYLDRIDKEMISTLRTRRANTLRRAKGGGYQKVAKATVNKTLRLLSRILNYAADNHDAKIRRIKWSNFFFDAPKVKKVRAISPEVQGIIIDALGPDYEALVCFAAIMGLRAQECLLQWDQVDFRNAMILDVAGKGHRIAGGRDVPIGKAAMTILRREHSRHDKAVFTRVAKKSGGIPRTDRKQIKGQRYPMTFTCWSSAWDRMRDKLRGKIPGIDIDKVRIHDLRHTAATRALNAGAQITQVQDMLGHSTAVITKAIYAHHNTDAIRAAQDAAAVLTKPAPLRPRSSTG